MDEYDSIQDVVANGTEGEHLGFINATSPAFLIVNVTDRRMFQSLRLALDAARVEQATARTLTIECLFNDQLENIDYREIAHW